MSDIKMVQYQTALPHKLVIEGILSTVGLRLQACNGIVAKCRLGGWGICSPQFSREVEVQVLVTMLSLSYKITEEK